MSPKRAVFAAIAILSVGGVVLVVVTSPKLSITGDADSSAPGVPPLDQESRLAPSTNSSQPAADALNETSALPAVVLESATSGVAMVRVAAMTAELPPADPDPSGLPPETVMENIRLVFRQFASRFNANPVGNNAEITAALNGGNPRQVQFLKAEDGLRVNSKGELVDSWGTPFFFHQLSGTEMEIHSAGPDRVMWTADDLVIK